MLRERLGVLMRFLSQLSACPKDNWPAGLDQSIRV